MLAGFGVSSFAGDGKVDLVFQQRATATITTWFIDGPKRAGDAVLLSSDNPAGSGWRVVGSGDFNGDGNPDLLFQHEAGTLAVWHMNGSNLVSTALISPDHPGDPHWRVVGTGDFNGDGMVDLLFQYDNPNGMLAVWLMNRTFLVAPVLVNPPYPGTNFRAKGAADFNRDGKLDIVFQHSEGLISLWLMDGTDVASATFFSPQFLPAGWQIKGMGDLSFDGKPDLVLQHSSGLIAPWFMDGTGRIQDATPVIQTPDAGTELVALADFGGGVPTDVDYDGRNDSEELVEGTDPHDADDVRPTRLGYWRFNNENLQGENGQLPMLATNVGNVVSFDGGGLQVDSANPALIKYRDVESDGAANVNCRRGSIRFLFKPDWSSASAGGTGPGSEARLFELGTWTPDASIGWWSLYLSADGNTVNFATQTNGFGITNLSATVGFNANVWYEITLTYTPSVSYLYVDGIKYGPGRRVRFFPNPQVRAQGFRIGSDEKGERQARGVFDEVETFNYELGDVDAYENNNVLGATVTAQPPRVDLQWRHSPNQKTVLQRKAPEENSWETLATGTAWRYADAGTNLAIGQRYEYRLLPGGENTWARNIQVGINAPPVEDRGRIILLVDSTVANALTTELDQLYADLTGDGWTVVRANVPRHDDLVWANNTNYIASIKTFITNTYFSYVDRMNTKAVFIVGHAAIPYSGFGAEDGHANHSGAWPADIYYGDVDGIWTDEISNPAEKFVSFPENSNQPGDGKFDQYFIPPDAQGLAQLELSVGRVDFARMPVFTAASTPGSSLVGEVNLLRQYLNKNHRYRHKQIALPDRSMVAGFFVGAEFGENADIYLHAQANGSAFFPAEAARILQGDIFTSQKPVLWGLQAGYGAPNGINCCDSPQVHSSANLVSPTNEPPVGFYLLKGSWFGDWNMVDNFLRATLATPNYGLAALWTRSTRWRLEFLALGEPLGTALVRTLNDKTVFFFGGKTILAIMGDPTLRLQITAPPTNLMATNSDAGVALAWSRSAEAAEYFVYRAGGLDGAFTNRIAALASTESSFTDTNAPAGRKVYQVRAANLMTTGSGSFTNLSQGIFAIVPE